MSQVNGLAGDTGTTLPSKASTTGRAVLLLAIAVILGVALLHELDNSSTSSTASQAAAPEEAVAPAVVTTLAPRSPAEVKILVANGVGVPGAAAKIAGRLQPIGYQLLKPGNTINKEVNSLVEFSPGYQAEAQAVATSLGIPAASVQAMPVPAPVQDLQAANVLIILGNDLANSAVNAPPAAGTQNPAEATTTTIAAGTAGPLNTVTPTTSAVVAPVR